MFEVAVWSGTVRSWVTLTGEFDLASAPYLEQVLDQLCGDGVPAAVLDLSGLDFLNAVGLGVFRADDRAPIRPRPATSHADAGELIAPAAQRLRAAHPPTARLESR
jgi:hypothetical protein